MEAPPKAFFKVLIVGDGAVGKTSLCTYMTTSEFFANYKLTVGCEFFIKRLYVSDVSVTLQIFDIGGQEQFRGLRPIFAGGAKGIFLTFDITRRDSFFNLEDAFMMIEKEIDPKATKVLIAAKNDLKNEREVWKEDINALMEILKIDAFVETSSLTGEGVYEAIEMMGRLLMARFEREEYLKSAQRRRFLDRFYRDF